MSITDNKDIHGYPKDFTFTITGVNIQPGAGFIVLYMGNILTMPGLSKDSHFKRIKFTK
jgi:formate--tetrahydrofolate ligase